MFTFLELKKKKSLLGNYSFHTLNSYTYDLVLKGSCFCILQTYHLLPCSSDCRLVLRTESRNWKACQALFPQIWGLKPQWNSRRCVSSTSSGRCASVAAFHLHAWNINFLKMRRAVWGVYSLIQCQKKLLSGSCRLNLLCICSVPRVVWMILQQTKCSHRYEVTVSAVSVTSLSKVFLNKELVLW